MPGLMGGVRPGAVRMLLTIEPVGIYSRGRFPRGRWKTAPIEGAPDKGAACRVLGHFSPRRMREIQVEGTGAVGSRSGWLATQPGSDSSLTGHTLNSAVSVTGS